MHVADFVCVASFRNQTLEYLIVECSRKWRPNFALFHAVKFKGWMSDMFVSTLTGRCSAVWETSLGIKKGKR